MKITLTCMCFRRLSVKDATMFILLGCLFLSSFNLRCEDALFIGNSFTNGHTPPVRTDGGVPQMVKVIAEARSRVLKIGMSAPDGAEWRNHLKNQSTLRQIEQEKWQIIVVQNLSLKPTRIGNKKQHCADGLALAERIWANSPNSKIVLFETWPRHPSHSLCRRGASEQVFVGSEEMMDELRDGYAQLLREIQSRNPAKHVVLARVGEAFERCRNTHPEINLYDGDLFHANEAGSYLAALVLYAAIFDDSPIGATSAFPSFSIPEDIAANLQKIAGEIWSNGVIQFSPP